MVVQKDSQTCADPRFMGCSDLPRVRKARTFAILTAIAGCGYLFWVWLHLNFFYPVPAVLFFAAEVFALGLFLAATINVWRLRFKPEEGMTAEMPFSVDVFITTAGEPLSIVKGTMTAAS